MNDNQANSRSTPDSKINAGDSATQKSEPTSHFRRALVPLDEYAAREGISSDILEKQGQLGVIQIRKFKGQKFVVDVPAEQAEEYENEKDSETFGHPVRPRASTASKLLTIGLTIVFMVILVSVFWLYMDTRQTLDDLRMEYTSLQNRYNDLAGSNKNLKTVQDELANSKAEFARIQNRIVVSKTDLEKIQADLIKTRRSLDTIQSDLAGIQGQISLSKVEIENTQNGLNETKGSLDKLYQQNTSPQSK